ncbi:Kelch repeat-containing protein [Halorhabdus amylolytica]|uniref:Kelch repeat-containing protein n=1 Tax=Halorhabdus amylolytica TaxID=2559573 RepID=UPI0010A9F4B9|nr:kelch repeat-containing protein [Halorhabdus amylolytica]
MSIKVAEGEFLWAVSGKKENKRTVDDTTVYSIEEDKWYSSLNGELAPIPHPVQGAGWTLYDGKIYAFGGKTEPHEGCSNYVQRYDIGDDEWTVLEEMPSCRSKLGKFYPVIKDRYVYLFGGDDEGGRFSRVNWNWKYDLKTDSWDTDVADAPYSQSFPLPTYHDGWLYYSTGNTQSKGGQNNYPGALNQRYNPSTDNWQVVAPVPHPVTDGEGDKWNGELHFLGGWNVNEDFYNPEKDYYIGPVKNQHIVYNYDANKWRYEKPLPGRWHHGGARASKEYLWRYLGTIDEDVDHDVGQFTDQVEQHTNKIFRWDGEEWTEMSPAPVWKMNFGTIYTEIGPKAV